MEAMQDRVNLWMHLYVYNGYPLSLVVALVLHFVLLAALVYSQVSRPPEILDIMQTPMIKALTIDENPQARNERLQQAALARQRTEEVAAAAAQQRQAAEAEAAAQAQREAAEQAAAEAARREAAAAEQRQADQRRQAAETAAAEEARRLAAAEEARKTAAAAEEARRQVEAEAEQRRLNEVANQRAQEAAEAASEVARTEREQVMAYTSVIHDLVQRNWSRPPSARNGMTVQFRLQLLPTGDIVNLELVRSSGDFAFDRAAETAIYKVGQFRELQGMPIRLFNENFRSLLLTFRPEDLLN